MLGVIDTGSVVVPSINDLTFIDEEYDDPNQAKTSMVAANGRRMTVTAKGSINDTLD
jgi:hypothetical protein